MPFYRDRVYPQLVKMLGDPKPIRDIRQRILLAPDPRLRRWQAWTEPLSHWVFEGCHLTRDIPSLIIQGGFHIDRMESGYLAAFPKSWTHCWWGTAIGFHGASAQSERGKPSTA